MEDAEISIAIKRHIRGFALTNVDVRPWSGEPLGGCLPDFEIAEIPPTTVRPYWTFLTVGCWRSGSLLPPAEFVLAADSRDGRHAETVAMAAFYNCEYQIELGSIIDLGEPWIEGSACDHLLVALPYPYGPELEEVAGTAVRYRWLLPITSKEVAFARGAGVEELEQLFDATEIDFANPARASVV